MKAAVDPKWPFHFSEILAKGNPESNFACVPFPDPSGP